MADKENLEKEKKKKKTAKPVKDHWFSFSGISKEFKRVRWPKLKSDGSTPGIAATTAEVITFTAFFAVYFVLCDFLITYLLKIIGIGG